MAHDKHEWAERFSQTRASMAPFLGLLVLAAQQGALYALDWGGQSLVQTFVWLAFALAMLTILLTGGGWFLPRDVRRIANDEITRANRRAGITAGFVVAMIAGFLVWAIAPFEPLHAQRAANIIVSLGLGCAFIAYGMAELRSDAAGR